MAISMDFILQGFAKYVIQQLFAIFFRVYLVNLPFIRENWRQSSDILALTCIKRSQNFLHVFINFYYSLITTNFAMLFLVQNISFRKSYCILKHIDTFFQIYHVYINFCSQKSHQIRGFSNTKINNFCKPAYYSTIFVGTFNSKQYWDIRKVPQKVIFFSKNI